MKRSAIVLAGIIALPLGAHANPAAVPSADPLSGPTLHFVKGVVVTHATVDAVNGGDGEGISRFTESTADSDSWTSHYVVTDPSSKKSKEITKGFQTLHQDQISARRMVCWIMPSDPETFPGYSSSCSLSTDQFKELKDRGSVAVNVGWINPIASLGIGGELGSLMQTRKHYRGVLKIVEPRVMLSVLVNGKPRDIPTIHVSGHLSIGDEGGDADFWVQDDPAVPFTVKVSFLGSTSQTTNVDLHTGAAADLSLEQNLAKQCRVDLPGIYFPTNSAELLSPSNAELDGLAATLQRHPDWILSVDGHTDNIGNAAANADLSARRAGTVRAALVARGVPAARIRSEGFGANRPVAANDSVTGRARNRRVELRRDCKVT